MRIIKRYRNRKLYDTVTGKYITRKACVNMVLAGIVIKIETHEGGMDITKDYLVGAVTEELFKKKTFNQFLTEVVNGVEAN